MAFQGKRKSAQKGESELARRFKANPLMVIGTFFVLVLVVVTFVGIGPAGCIIDGVRGGHPTFGFYDGAPVTLAPGTHFFHDEQRDMQLRQMQAFLPGDGQPVPDWLRNWERNTWRESFETALFHTAILRTMQRAGFAPPDSVVSRYMARHPIFMDENGLFSEAQYRRLDDQGRNTLWRQTQDAVVVSRFIADVEGLVTPSAESEFVGRMASTQRSFDMAVFPVDAFPDYEIEIYALENPDLFRSAHLSIITIDGNEREARRIRASVADGEMTFEEAVSRYSADMFSIWGGDMGPTMAHALRLHVPDSAVLEAALSLAAGELGDVMNTADGWVFFRAEADAAEMDLSDPAVMEGVRDYMRSFARGRMEDWAIAQAEKFGEQVNGYGFEAALELHPEVERRDFGPVPINFGNVGLFGTLTGVAELMGSASSEHFWTVAFGTPLESPSIPVVQGGNVLVLFPTAETEAHYTGNAQVAFNYANFWLSMTELLPRHFLDSPRFRDRFEETLERNQWLLMAR